VLSSDIRVRAAGPADRDAWLDMWHAYCAFYEVAIPAGVSVRTWERILTPDSGIAALLAVDASNRPAGFTNFVVHPYTWSDRPCCYLEDLFVWPDLRGQGVGRALIERLLALGEARGWSRVYWMTRESNLAARRLYDRFTVRDDFVRYAVALAAPENADHSGV
jgi:GNAT superfamily N-acetyltransferase